MDATNPFPHPTTPHTGQYTHCTQTAPPVRLHQSHPPSTYGHTPHDQLCSNNLFITVLPSLHSLSPIIARLASQSHAQDCRQQHALNRLTRRAGRSSSPRHHPLSLVRILPSSIVRRPRLDLGVLVATSLVPLKPPTLGIDSSVRSRPFCEALRTVSARTLRTTHHPQAIPSHTHCTTVHWATPCILHRDIPRPPDQDCARALYNPPLPPSHATHLPFTPHHPPPLPRQPTFDGTRGLVHLSP